MILNFNLIRQREARDAKLAAAAPAAAQLKLNYPLTTDAQAMVLHKEYLRGVSQSARVALLQFSEYKQLQIVKEVDLWNRQTATGKEGRPINLSARVVYVCKIKHEIQQQGRPSVAHQVQIGQAESNNGQAAIAAATQAAAASALPPSNKLASASPIAAAPQQSTRPNHPTVDEMIAQLRRHILKDNHKQRAIPASAAASALPLNSN